MRHPAFERRLALRVDVDFVAGLERAVPFMLEALGRAGMRATFFVVAGSNRPRRSWRRLLRPGYVKRLARLGPRRIASTFGASLLGTGEMLGSEARREVVRRIEAAGHEVAVHGFDHAWWADHVWSADTEALEAQIDRGYERLQRVSGGGGHAWGSPNWRTTPAVLRSLVRRGVPYLADCWGHAPFRTVAGDGAALDVPHLPITRPSLEGLVLELELEPRAAVETVLTGVEDDRFAMLCVHDYFEGLMRPELFELLLDVLVRRGVTATTLREAAAAPAQILESLEASPLVRRPVAGFAGEVSWQAPAGTSAQGLPPGGETSSRCSATTRRAAEA